MREKFRLFVGSAKQNWYVEYYENGKRKKVYGGSDFGMLENGNGIKSLIERKKYFQELFKRVQNPNPSNDRQIINISTTTLKSAFSIYFDAHKSILNARTYKGNLIIANRFLKSIPQSSLSDITTATITTYFDTKSIAPQSINSDRSVLHTIFNYLLSLNLVSENPVTKYKKRKIIKREKNECYTSDELSLVFDGLSDYSANIYLIGCFMYAAFLRGSEIIRLKREHLDFEKSLIYLPGELRKTNDFFLIPMTPQLKADLILHKKDLLTPNNYILTNNSNAPLSDIYYSMTFYKLKRTVFAKWISKHQTLNSIRHTAAINYFQKTQNLKKLSMLMGHSSVQTTIIYLRSLGKIVGDISESDLLEY